MINNEIDTQEQKERRYEAFEAGFTRLDEAKKLRKQARIDVEIASLESIVSFKKIIEK